MPGPRLAPRARPQAWPAPEPWGTGRLGLAVGWKEAAPGAVGPQATSFVGEAASSAPRGRGGTTPRGPGPGYGVMWNRAAARATDPGPTGRRWLGMGGMGGVTPHSDHGSRKRRGHSHG